MKHKCMQPGKNATEDTAKGTKRKYQLLDQMENSENITERTNDDAEKASEGECRGYPLPSKIMLEGSLADSIYLETIKKTSPLKSFSWWRQGNLNPNSNPCQK
jgi:hypothetical protein